VKLVVVNHGVKKELRARAGSNRSPWKGGGVILDQNHFLKLNKKERRLALQTLLYNKKNNILIIENLENEINNLKQNLKFVKIVRLI
jgi:ribosomal protein L4